MNTTQSSALVAVIAACALAIGLFAGVYLTRPTQTLGSVVQGNEYTSTTTGMSVAYGNTITGDKVLKTGAGSLAQVTLTGANTGIVNFYDATTSNVALRTGQAATSTILIASLPVSLAAGTYTYDAQFAFGLFLDIDTGNMPTTTITWR